MGSETEIVDVVGVGFGPSNLALAIAAQVDHGTEVIGIDPADGGGECLEVVTFRPGSGTARLRARNVVLGTGLRPYLPEGVSTGPRIRHSSDLLPKAATLASHQRLTVVGTGQSAAESRSAGVSSDGLMTLAGRRTGLLAASAYTWGGYLNVSCSER
ncbi:MAG: SidA/IucD/PvdA family monooxygenase [Pseudonocardiaceae bacterium]